MIRPNLEHSDFLHVFDNTKDRLYRLFLKHTGDVHATNDLLQEAYLRIWSHRDTIHKEGAEHYLFTTAYNLLADWHRKKLRSQIHLMEELPEKEETITPEEAYEYKVTQQRVADALASLSPRQRAAYQLIREEEKSYKEAAEALNTPVSTLEKQVAAGLRLLKKALHLFF